MKFNQWTLGLAAVGAVSLASAASAEEAKLSQVQTALSNTTISGYVDVAAQWNAGNPGKTQAYNQPLGLSSSKVDGFTANNVTISLDKPQDETPWASGYHVDLNAGTDAITPLNSVSTPGATISTVGLRQAYIALRTPVGNGIDWKVGLFDGITGYESNTGYSNPNYTRSYGYQVNPASALGMLGTYKVSSLVSVQAGLANRGNNFAGGYLPLGQTSAGLSSKDVIFGLALTAPDSWGFLKGSTLNAGTFQGFDNGAVNNYSVNATLSTPVTGLKVGLAYDKVQSLVGEGVDFNVYGVYATFDATSKLHLAVRGEMTDGVITHQEEVTATLQYDLWANVVSRLEARWDHVEHGVGFNNGAYDAGATASTGDAFLLALNLVYKF